MKISKDKTATMIALFLIFAMTFSLFALPVVHAQTLIMNLPGDEGVPHNVELHEEIDIDLNGPSSYIANVELWVKYPDRVDFTYIGVYPTTSGGDLDVYDFDFNETGDFELKWMVGATSSNVEIARVWPVGQVPAVVTEVPTHIYVSATPVTGVNEQMFIVYWTDQIPPDIGEQEGSVTSPTGRQGWYDVQVVITYPDGTNETNDMPYSDPVGGGYLLFTPTEVGLYSAKAVFPGTWKNTTRDHRWYTTCESIVQNFTVREEPVAQWTEAPLPTEYWMRPISGASHTWQALAGNWLGGSAQQWPTGATGGTTSNYAYGSAPESAHILWTHSHFDSGSLVDERFDVPEAYTLNHYQGVSFSSIIVDGKIHYATQYTAHQRNVGWETLSLYTGERLSLDFEVTAPDFGQTYIYNSGNQHGGFAYLWRTSGVTLPETVTIAHAKLVRAGDLPARTAPSTTVSSSDIRRGTLWEMIDAFTGNTVCYVANVSSGTSVYGKDGSILRYRTQNLGTSSNPNYYLMIWNSSAGTMVSCQFGTGAWQWKPMGGGSHGAYDTYFPSGQESGVRRNIVHDGNLMWSLNVSIPSILGPRNALLNQTASIRAVREDEYVVFGTTGRNDERGIVKGWLMAVSLEPGKEGTKLWETTFTPPFDPIGNYQGVDFRGVVPEQEVILFRSETELKWYAYDMMTGDKLWESEPRPQLEYYSMDSNIYNDTLLASGRAGGVLTAYDLRTGEKRWEYIAEGEGTETPYGNSVIRGTLVADGKVYLSCSEHSASTPLWRGPNLRCLNVTTGEEIWKILFWGGGSERVADGILIGWSLYDGQVYAFGKGPSATTVTAPQTNPTIGSSVTLIGTVTDQTPTGRRNINNEVQFTLEGTPAIADDDMQGWMEYKFMGQSYPADAKGVEVVLETLDPNGNFYEIGRTTSDITGNYGLEFTPEVPGDYQIFATFKGSKSYYPSTSITYMSVAEAPQASPTPTPPPPSMTDTYVLGIGAGAIIAIVVVGLVLILMLRKR